MSVRDAVIVSTARTAIGRAYRGAFNATPSPTLAAHAIKAAVERAGVDPAEIDDVHHGRARCSRASRRRSAAPPRCAPACPSPSPACRSTASARRG